MSQQANDKAIGAALTEVFSDWLVNRPDVFVTSRCSMSSGVDPGCLYDDSAAALLGGSAAGFGSFFQPVNDTQVDQAPSMLLLWEAACTSTQTLI